jgi:hypothetical protein
MLAAPTLNVCEFEMNLHATTSVDGRDRKRLERLCRYLLRPPFAQDAIERRPDGRVRLHLSRSGTHVDMSPHQFLAKLIALVPPPGLHMFAAVYQTARSLRSGLRGIFANRHHLRKHIVPHREIVEPTQLSIFDFEGRPLLIDEQALEARPRRVGWARLLARVFAIDVTKRPLAPSEARGRFGSRCGGRLAMLAAVVDPDEIASLLYGARAPPKPSPAGQLALVL